MHPGGRQILASSLGIDCSKYFNNSQREERKKPVAVGAEKSKTHNHSRFAHFMLASMAIGHIPYSKKEKKDIEGRIINPSEKVINSSILESDSEGETSALEFKTYRITARDVVTKANAKKCVLRLVVELDGGMSVFFAPGNHVYFQHVDENERIVTRPYTPIKSGKKNKLEFFVKMYGGEMTSHLEKTTTDEIRASFSPNHSQICPSIAFKNAKNGCWPSLGLICGGTGLSFMLNLLEYYYLDENLPEGDLQGKKTRSIHLINAQSTPDDMFGLSELNSLILRSQETLTVTNLVSSNTSEEDGFQVGKIDEELIRRVFPKPSNDMMVIICGPPKMGPDMLKVVEMVGFPNSSIQVI